MPYDLFRRGESAHESLPRQGVAGPSLPSSSGTGYTITATTEHAPAHHNSARHEQRSVSGGQPESPFFQSTPLTHASTQETVPPRPSTATTFRAIRPLEELLPPKRDLPFANPAAKRAYQNTNLPNAKPKTSPTTTHHSPQQPQQHPNELTMLDLSSYFSEPTQQRTAKLQNWICEHLDDDAFLQLCQDVEGAWVRIALGK
ncbi:hypothetical protein BDW42DRAFT_193355 [Aspergillus taichungensis]|uniref:Uncharacterized protein n=1 Tax=Aspergillus taichungensis TaxID=482145 RepID=A0A2J5HWZ0_9EURO|nr:hypothetical protein BDW42DRAFT_193355 [Aspergillus taichungensis]